MVEREDWKRVYERYHPRRKYYIAMLMIIFIVATGFFLFHAPQKPPDDVINRTSAFPKFSVSYENSSLYIRNEGNYTIPAKNISIYIDGTKTDFTNIATIEPGETRIIPVQLENANKSIEISVIGFNLTKRLIATPSFECESGPCCASEKKFRDPSYTCQYNFSTELGCPWGNESGSDVGIRYNNRYCTGNSSECGGMLLWSGWSIYKDCLGNETCRNSTCVFFNITTAPPACMNECNLTQIECSGSGYRICGNYDNDTCAEWGNVINCSLGYACVNGSCALAKCSDNTTYGSCSATKPKYCQSGTLIDKCSVCGCGTNYTCSITTEACQSIRTIGGDLDVVFIERTPKYEKYRVTYFGDRRGCQPEYSSYYPYSEDRGPQLCPSQKDRKRWPDTNEQVTFTAYVKNNDNISTGSFEFKWFIDGVEVKTGLHTSIDSGRTENETFQWQWPSSLDDHKVKFVADPSNLIVEKHETNNEAEGYTNALYFFIGINNATYNSLKSQIGNSNPTSTEDWVKSQINKMNALFSDAGVLEHVRIDKIVISEYDFSDSEKYSSDGTWFINSDYRITSGYYDSAEDIDYGLLHELIHQLGIIDLYTMNSDTQYDKLWDKKYSRQGAGCGTEYGWPASWDCYSIGFAQPSIGNDLANNIAHQIGLHTANALNKNLHKRRGYFGEYLFDVPETIKVRFLKSNGQPLDSATIKVYQPGSGRIIDLTKLKQTLVTDTNGLVTLQPVAGIWTDTNVTETNHKLKPNPFGLIDVVGNNGLFLFEIEKSGFDYKWLPLALANMEYWKGNTTEATFTITTALV